ncbi:hypothetical protein Q7A53_05355 [Halobacillus rhizosphaerae]|uniref:hypothetical protein n=1 Tax=Halobacillus rhizosphaerae TaxID=3064889 RepID=UPI00398B6787
MGSIIYVFIALVLTLTVVFIVSLITEHSLGEKFIGVGMFAGCILGFLLVLFPAMIFLNHIFENGERYHKVSSTINIVALQDGQGVHGEFFLGSGYIDGELQYNYAIKKDGGYKIDSINASSYVVRYIDDNSKPRIEEIEEGFENNFLKFMFFTGTKKYIYVPQGTVKEGYNIDLK